MKPTLSRRVNARSKLLSQVPILQSSTSPSNLSSIPPQPIASTGVIPQLDRAVLATRGIQLAVWAKGNTPYWPVMPLAHLQLLLRVEVPHAHVRVTRPARHKAPLRRMYRHARDLVRRLDRLEQRRGLGAVEEVHALTGRDAERTGAGIADGRTRNIAAGHVPVVERRPGRGCGGQLEVQLACADCAFHCVLADRALCPQVPPPDLLVVGGRDEDVAIGGPDNTLDGALVHTCADFVGRRGCLGSVVGVCGGKSRRWGGGAGGLGEVEDAKFLLHAARCEDLGTWLAGEGDGADDVIVGESVEHFAGECVPDISALVSVEGCKSSSL